MEKKSYGNELLHSVLLSVMKDVDKVCKENNINYYLHAGTLLGAVQHKGFIPWDDDVDITMFSDDYEKFSELMKLEFSDKYFIQTYKSDYFHPDNRMKIRVNGTAFNTCGEYDKKLKSNGIFVDIAPLYNVPNNRVLRKIQKKLIFIIDSIIQIKLGLIQPISIKSKLLLKPLSKLDRVFLGRTIDLIMKKMGNNNSRDVGTLSCTFRNEYMNIDGYENDIRPKDYYKNPIYIDFEDTKFMTITNYHEDLLKRYGEKYMEPYPEEKRITKHGLEDFKISSEVRKRLNL
ncbi:hypothetical protein GNF31_13670 [Clostridium perfringens]|uniref:LicD family protein n=1 Tax=Clostridium perfringens TaxID=1502 RepID=UPI002AC42A2C|nr:LicD family protein [Clostridium perfringens]MDZ4983573.1 hypothetical protein [Clostridium perfringens]